MERKTSVHRIKILPEYFEKVKARHKNFEIRVNDRDYQVGDLVVLNEHTGVFYTGRGVTRKIKYILKDCPQYGLKDGYCIFGW